MRKLFYTLFFVGILLSCNKEPILEVAPSLVGIWKHHSAVDAWHIIYIYENGKGIMQWFRNYKLYKDTKERDWWMKNNTIYFGKTAFNGELYDVETFPTLTGQTFTDNFDTIYAGKRYIVLDGNYYSE